MKITLPDFSQAKILIVGDVMLDQYWFGLSNRISSEAPVPIVKVNTVEERPGGAANVAMNTATLGCQTQLVALTGRDSLAKVLSTSLSKLNITCDFITVVTHPTMTKIRVLSRNKQLIRLDFEQNFDNIDSKPIIDRIKSALPKNNVLVLSDYAKGTLTHVSEMITLANAASIPVLVDPQGTNFYRYQGATLLTPNLSEFEAVVGVCKDEKTLIYRGMKIITDYQLSALLITRAELGMTLLQPHKEPLYLPTQAQDIYDVTGAGDTVISVLAAALATGNSLEESCFLANVAAGIVVEKLGTSTVSLIELKNAIHNKFKTKVNIMSENELKQAIILARKRGEKIVLTNGIFDILHAGHVSYLVNARQLGDRLIVAVNSDESTKRLKGNNRPINPLAQRMTVLAALKVVDWVVSFNDDTPRRLIANILPDILVKGGDYQPHEIYGSQEVWNNGGNVIVINFIEGCSTTNIINTIKHN